MEEGANLDLDLDLRLRLAIARKREEREDGSASQVWEFSPPAAVAVAMPIESSHYGSGSVDSGATRTMAYRDII